MRCFLLPCILPKLGTQRSEEYFRQAKEPSWGRPLKILVEGQVSRGHEQCRRKHRKDEPFVMGDAVSWANLFLSGEDSEEWKSLPEKMEDRKNFLLGSGCKSQRLCL